MGWVIAIAILGGVVAVSRLANAAAARVPKYAVGQRVTGKDFGSPGTEVVSGTILDIQNLHGESGTEIRYHVATDAGATVLLFESWIVSSP